MPQDPEYDGYQNEDWWGSVGDLPQEGGQPSIDYLPGEDPTSSTGLSQDSGGNPPQSAGTDYEAKMKGDLGDLYTPGAYEELQHHDFDQGWYDRIVNKENLRADNETGSTYNEDGKGGYLTKEKQPVGLRTLSGGGMKGGAGSAGSNGPTSMDDIMGQLKGLFPNGAFNQDVVNRRVSNASDAMNRNKHSQLQNNQAYLADRGLVGSGPEATAYTNMEDRLNQNFNSSVNDIYATEGENADNRMMQALSLATGMSTAEAQMTIDRFRANTEHDLGFGNLAARNKEADQSYGLGMTRAGNDFTLGQGGLALGNINSQNQNNQFYDSLQHAIESGNTDQLLELIKIMMGGADTSAGGHF